VSRHSHCWPGLYQFCRGQLRLLPVGSFLRSQTATTSVSYGLRIAHRAVSRQSYSHVVDDLHLVLVDVADMYVGVDALSVAAVSKG
jgi:hypothetical protein